MCIIEKTKGRNMQLPDSLMAEECRIILVSKLASNQLFLILKDPNWLKLMNSM